MGDSQWADSLQGVIVAPVGATCWARDPEPDDCTATFDFFAMARELRPLVEQVRIMAGAPTCPHSPVHLKLAGLGQHACVSQVRRCKASPTEPWIGPRALPPERGVWGSLLIIVNDSQLRGFSSFFASCRELL